MFASLKFFVSLYISSQKHASICRSKSYSCCGIVSSCYESYLSSTEYLKHCDNCTIPHNVGHDCVCSLKDFPLCLEFLSLFPGFTEVFYALLQKYHCGLLGFGSTQFMSFMSRYHGADQVTLRCGNPSRTGEYEQRQNYTGGYDIAELPSRKYLSVCVFSYHANAAPVHEPFL